jgi:hypothetical protein
MMPYGLSGCLSRSTGCSRGVDTEDASALNALTNRCKANKRNQRHGVVWCGVRSSTEAPKLKIKLRLELTCRSGSDEASESDDDYRLEVEVELELHGVLA